MVPFARHSPNADHKEPRRFAPIFAILLSDCIKAFLAICKSRIYSEGFPERKIILRPGQVLPRTNEDDILSKATIELVGRSFELFGVLDTATRLFTWPEFLSHIHPNELVSAWNEDIRHLAIAALKGDYGDNYHVVSSPNRDKAFRMFV